MTIAAKNDGIAYQGASYEGLTVNFLELAFAAGGKILSDDGTKPEIDSPQNVKALKFMVDGIKSGAAPKAVTTYMEEPARRTFESGKATFMRNWPYCYALAQEAPKTKGKFAVVPYPAFEGGGKAGILGGANLVISTYSKNPGGALKFIDYMTHDGAPERGRRQVLRRLAAEGGLRRPGGPEGAAVLGRSQDRDRAGQDAPGLPGLLAGFRGDLQERQQGAVGQRLAGGRAQEGPERYAEGARDVLSGSSANRRRGCPSATVTASSRRGRPGARAGAHLQLARAGHATRTPAQLAGRAELRAALNVDEHAPRAARAVVALAPLHQRVDRGPELLAALGQQQLVAPRPVGPALDEPALDERRRCAR